MGHTTLVHLVSRVALAGLFVALLVTGAGTAALLHHHAIRDVEQLLHVAAQSGQNVDLWVNGHHPGPVEVRTWDPAQEVPPEISGVPPATLLRAVESEEPLRIERDGEVILLLAVEPPDVHDVDPAPEDHPHALRIVRAARPGLLESTGRFSALYSLVALGVLSLAWFTLPRLLARTLAPLDDTRVALEKIQGLAVRSRLPEGGPVEVARLITSVNALLQRLEDAVSAQTRFTAAAAHELRTPVALLRGELELALRRPRSPEEYQAALSEALESVVRLEGLVEGLMALARVHAGQVEEGLQPEHLSSLVSVALATERGRILARGGEVEVDLATDPELVVHGPLLTAAIANLLRNAADHAPGAAVRVTVEPSPREGNDGVTVTVDDNGPGQGSSEPHGLGIGLRVCREVLARHGGSVHTGSSPTGGMRARLWLPLGRA